MAGTYKLSLFLVPGDRAPQVRAYGGQNAKLALDVSGDIDRLFGYCFAPAIHLLNLNSAQHRLGQGREVGQRPKRGRFEFGGTPQERKQSEANERYRKQRTHEK